MKGIFLKKPLEYTLNINSEEFRQGDTVEGSLEIKNHGIDDLPLDEYSLTLQKGATKKIKVKDEKSFKLIQKSKFQKNHIIKPGESHTENFSFPLSLNETVSDKSQSLYILCGKEDLPFEGGTLAITVLPSSMVTYYMEILTNFFKFKIKSIKSKKDILEIKAAPPVSKDYSSVELLTLEIELKQEIMIFDYIFKIKRLKMDEGLLKAKTENYSIKKQLTPSEYVLYKDSYNQENFIKSITHVTEDIKKKTTLV